MPILAPNPLFLNFIAGVLPDLGVERVRQTTFLRFVSGWLGKLLPKVQEVARCLGELLAAACAARVSASQTSSCSPHPHPRGCARPA